MEWKPGISTITSDEWDWDAVVEYIKTIKGGSEPDDRGQQNHADVRPV